jgi:hypothetical protein
MIETSAFLFHLHYKVIYYFRFYNSLYVLSRYNKCCMGFTLHPVLLG